MSDRCHMPIAHPSFLDLPWPGRLLQPLPLWPLQRLASIAMQGLVRRHQESFTRLRVLGDSCFLIVPTDYPFVMAIWPGLDKPRLALVSRSKKAPEAVALIRGTMASFLVLLEGRADGDALFFSRELSIDGDIAAVLCLRNAIDGAEIDFLRDICGSCGPLASPIERGLRLHSRAAKDLVRLGADIKRTFLQSSPLRQQEGRHDER